MNWKFWKKNEVTTPAQAMAQERWSQTYDIAPLRARLAGLDKADPLYPLLLGFLDAQVVAQADGRVTPDMAMNVVGRMNMCADLKSDLRKLWQDAHRAEK